VATPQTVPSPSASVFTLVTQTRVRADHADAFGRWQQHVNDTVSRFPGYVDHEVVPPSPPVQPDWVIVQRFSSVEAARAWLGSEERRRLLEEAHPWLVGPDDIHLVEDGAPRGVLTPVSTVISTRVAPGQEGQYRAWQRRIAAAQARAAGFQGYKLEPPIPGIQDDWIAILQFDSEAHLTAWMTSPERRKLLDEAAAFTSGTYARTVRTGFDQWFRMADSDVAPPPAWKQNMLVLLALYPVVFLFGVWVGTPLLMDRAGLPFWLTLFIGNIASVLILNRLVPWVSGRFRWWLHPDAPNPQRVNLTGIVTLLALYALALLLFSRFP
jgi:antibiotic biosynthesis monooxygenase (ABM) superfamily enzyme